MNDQLDKIEEHASRMKALLDDTGAEINGLYTTCNWLIFTATAGWIAFVIALLC